MSQIYHKEPPTCGKVLLNTTYGDIEIELWSKEAPLACRNFVQHCLDGYYDSCSFFRIIPGFMAQTGDPDNTSKGGTSIWGKEFKDEFHSRLLYNHRGIVGMANSQEPNSNRSQFFLTFAACEWLNKKNTIFGRVTGDTIFNLMRLGEVDLDGEKPTEECQIMATQVLINPFDDVFPRRSIDATLTAKTGASDTIQGRSAAKRGIYELKSGHKDERAGKVVKDSKLLSFEEGHGEEEDEEDVSALLKRKKRERMNEKERLAVTASTVKESEKLNMAQVLEERLPGYDLQKRSPSAPPIKAPDDSSNGRSSSISNNNNNNNNNNNGSSSSKRGGSMLDSFRQEYLRNRGNNGTVIHHGVRGNDDEALEKRQKNTLDRLQLFSSSLRKQKVAGDAKEKSIVSESYHGQVLESESDDDEECLRREGTWHLGKLKFKKHIDDDARGCVELTGNNSS